MRNRHKEVCPVIIHLAFHISLFPSGVRVTEPDTEVVMGTKTGKKFCFVDPGPAQVDFGEADFYESGKLIRKKYLT